MRAHTRKHPTEATSSPLEEEISDDTPITADEYYKQVYGDFPKWAVCLSGLRHREELTQNELGKLLGVTQGNISAMERGKRPIGKQLAKRLAKAFKTDYRLFL